MVSFSSLPTEVWNSRQLATNMSLRSHIQMRYSLTKKSKPQAAFRKKSKTTAPSNLRQKLGNKMFFYLFPTQSYILHLIFIAHPLHTTQPV